ncbi:hypothetical protein RAS1_07480 [Phycisphaerae bacterium RAS1]|nr:hypothetical protein RAS1_07480 [Phycisphaerae bacterium RAS1]
MKALPTRVTPAPKTKQDNRVLSGSVLENASGLLDAEAARSRKGNEPRRRGTIAAPVFRVSNKQVKDFLVFINGEQRAGAKVRMRLADLKMEDTEAYGRAVVKGVLGVAGRETRAGCANAA